MNFFSTTNISHLLKPLLSLCVAVFFFICAENPPAVAKNLRAGYSRQQELVDRACITFNSFIANPDMNWFRQHLASAKAVFILPRNLRGGFIIGAEGGTGVMLARDDRTGKWSYPAFYTMTSVSFGLQAGAETSEIILLIMTDSGIDSVLSTSFKLGADATIAAGPVGAGAMTATVDVVAFSKSRGAYGGVSITGAMIKSDDEWNRAYYGQYIRPVDIMITGKVKNPGAERLMKIIQKGAEAQAGQAIRRPPEPKEKKMPQETGI
jgi:lipid-binding SYLF domain-containing protein